MESEPARCRASLLTRARRKPWHSSSPLSALATTQPVDGARLISGYGAVRLRGGQLGASSPVRVLVL
jgi:hypothetical protein